MRAGYEYLWRRFQTDMNVIDVLQKRLYGSYKQPGNNFFRGLKTAVEKPFLCGFSRGEMGTINSKFVWLNGL